MTFLISRDRSNIAENGVVTDIRLTNEYLMKTLDDYFEFSGNTYEGD